MQDGQVHAFATVVAAAVSTGQSVRARWLAFGAPATSWSAWETIAGVAVAGRSASAGGSVSDLDNFTLVFARAVEERVQARAHGNRCTLQWVKQGSPVEIVAASAIEVVTDTPGASCTITLRDLGDSVAVQASGGCVE
jgi:hypothetical protein